MSIDAKVGGPSGLGGFLKGVFYTLSLAALFSLFPLKDMKVDWINYFNNLSLFVMFTNQSIHYS